MAVRVITKDHGTFIVNADDFDSYDGQLEVGDDKAVFASGEWVLAVVVDDNELEIVEAEIVPRVVDEVTVELATGTVWADADGDQLTVRDGYWWRRYPEYFDTEHGGRFNLNCTVDERILVASGYGPYTEVLDA